MSAYDRIFIPLWMLVPAAERLVLARDLAVPKSGVTEIRDQEVITDGHTNEDLANITAEHMAAYVGSEDTFARLWELSVAKARSEVHPPEPLPVSDPKELDAAITHADNTPIHGTKTAKKK